MKIFISWSGERSHALGKALHEWLPMVMQHVEPWLSQSDINAGERWASQVGKELESCNFGIICITKENAISPWILFEAGALSKSMFDGRVIPLLLDIDFKEITGPLAQFQAKKVDRDGVLDVVTAINQIAEGKLAEQRLATQFDALWMILEKAVSEIPANTVPARHNRPQQEILEELVSGVRGIEMRFRDISDDNPRLRRRRARLRPMMLMDFLHGKEFSPRDPMYFLIFSSLLKDDLPWFYELGAEAYREAMHRPNRSPIARRRFFAAVKMLRHGPLIEAIGDKDTYILLRELEHMIMSFDDDIADEDTNSSIEEN